MQISVRSTKNSREFLSEMHDAQHRARHIFQPAIRDIGKVVMVCSLEKGSFVKKIRSS